MSSKSIRIFVVVASVLVLCAGSVASAQEREGGRVFTTDPNPAPAEPGGAGSELVTDGGFEAGTPNPFWTETSTNFGTPLCTVATCGTGGGTGPNTGTWWAWFGGITAPETGSVSQTIAGGADDSCTLTFFLEIPAASGNGTDFLDVEIGGQTVFSVTEADDSQYTTYNQVLVDVSTAIDGTDQILEFNSTISGTPAVTNFFVDDVSLTCQAPVPALPSWALSVLVLVLLSGGLVLTRLRLG